MSMNTLCIDILLAISSHLYINNLGVFILHGKYIYNCRHIILLQNPDLNKYTQFVDSVSSYRYIVFNNPVSHILSNIPDLLHDIYYNFNRDELYAITNTVSYYIVNNVIDKEVAEIYLFNIYMKTSINSGFNYANLVRRKYKNSRVKLCWILFKEVFNYNWEYFNINLYDLFYVIYCTVYKRYNALYDTLYNIKIHKSLEPLKTMYILLCYKENIITITEGGNGDDEGSNGAIDALDINDNTLSLFNFVIIYILYIYIENIHQYIINTEFKRLIPAILEKCLEIKNGIDDNNRMPNNLKLMFLRKNNDVYNLYNT